MLSSCFSICDLVPHVGLDHRLWYESLLHEDDIIVVENGQRSDRRRKETVAHDLLT